MKDRVILHVDVNNAFLSWSAVWLLKNGYKVDIRNRFAVIGGDEKKRKGVVLAKSIPAKQMGVVTGESLYLAKKKCPNLEVFPPNFKIYSLSSSILYLQFKILITFFRISLFNLVKYSCTFKMAPSSINEEIGYAISYSCVLIKELICFFMMG